MNRLYISFIFIICAIISQAQNSSYFNDFFDNANFNAAYIPMNQGFKLGFLGYKNLESPYTPGYFSVNTSYTTKDNLSIGLRLVNKHYGFHSFYQLDGIIAHRLALTNNDSLSIAINLGGATNTFNQDYLNRYTEVDPAIDVYNKTFFSSGASLLYTHKKVLELGASAPILATSDYGLRPLMYFSAATNFEANDFTIKPQLIYELNSYSNLLDMSIRLKYVNRYWAKVSYNTFESATFGLGFNLKLVEIGYAYKLNANDYSRNLLGLHLLNITIRH